VVEPVVVGAGTILGVLLLAYLAGVLRVPSAELVDVGRWQTGSDGSIEVVTTVDVTSPRLLGRGVGDVDVSYHLDLNGVRLASGEKTDLELAGGTRQVELTSTVSDRQLPAWWVAYVRNNETIDVAVGGELSVDSMVRSPVTVPTVRRQLLTEETPVIDVLSRAADSITGTYTVSPSSLLSQFTGGLFDFGGADPTVGYEIERGWAKWGSVRESETTVIFHFTVRNAGDAPVPVTPDGIRLSLEMNDVELFSGDGEALDLVETANEEPLPPGERRTVEYTVRLANDRIADWFASHVRDGEHTKLRAGLQFVFQPPVLNIEIAVPREGVTTATCDIQTSILEDQPTRTDCNSLADLAGEFSGQSTRRRRDSR
jgi:LEA14-like dessication related protein